MIEKKLSDLELLRSALLNIDDAISFLRQMRGSEFRVESEALLHFLYYGFEYGKDIIEKERHKTEML